MYTETTSSSLEDQIVRGIFHAYPVLRAHVSKIKELPRETEIQLPHALILMELIERENMSVTQLSRHTCIAMPNITPIIDKLCALQYVERHHSKNDRRMVEISILPGGVECVDKIKKALIEQIFHENVSYSDAQLTRLNDALFTLLKLLPIGS